MSATVTLLVLAAALAHALWNAFVKKGQDPLISIAGIAASCGFFAALCLPWLGWPEPHIWPWIVTSILIHTVYMLMLSQAYRYGEFSLAYPIARGTAPALVVLASLFLLHEALSLNQLIAIGGILFSILLFALRRFEQVLTNQRSLIYALITACLIASYSLLDGLAARAATNALNYAAWVLTLQAIPVFIVMLQKKGSSALRILQQDIYRIAGGGLMAFCGYSAVLWAMTQAPIALVAAFRESSIIIAALIGTIWFKEPAGWRRILATALIFISVVILNLR